MTQPTQNKSKTVAESFMKDFLLPKLMMLAMSGTAVYIALNINQVLGLVFP